MDQLIIFTILILFSFIQSIFGVGLLLFGTPTLILFGFEYHQILNILLPASISISFLQFKNSKENISQSKKDFIYFCLPILIFFTVIVLFFENFINFQLIISVMLILSSLCALNKHKIKNLKNIAIKNSKIILIIIGFIHGVSNMGGGFLSIYNTTINNNKYVSRKNIAYAYLMMGLFQFIILFLIYYDELYLNYFYYAIVTMFIYFLSQKFFLIISEKKFSKVISLISLVYGFYILHNLLIN